MRFDPEAGIDGRVSTITLLLWITTLGLTVAALAFKTGVSGFRGSFSSIGRASSMPGGPTCPGLLIMLLLTDTLGEDGKCRQRHGA
jgi:hypothetical protein